MKIGLFDSGLGGLNVLSEFIKKYPNNTYYYYGDTKNVPYGEKDKETLLKLSTNIINFFEEKKVDLIIIACGTVSSSCYRELKELTFIKVLDIITPTINYLNDLNLNKVLVFGTKRTIESHIFKERLNANVYEVKTPEFVPMIENSCIDTNVVKSYCMEKFGFEALILGCTHYPLLIPEFRKYLSKDTKIIDMGKCLVDSLDITTTNNLEVNLFFTKIDDNLKKNINKIISCSYSLNEIVA